MLLLLLLLYYHDVAVEYSLSAVYDYQAINNLAQGDDSNTKRIVSAGALPHYVRLISDDKFPHLQQKVVDGLQWMMTYVDKDSVQSKDLETVLNGQYLFLLIAYLVRASGGEVL